MNIYNSQLFWCEQKRGTIGFDTLPYDFYGVIPWDSVPLHDFVRVRVGGRTRCEGAVANQGLGEIPPPKKKRDDENLWWGTIYIEKHILL